MPVTTVLTEKLGLPRPDPPAPPARGIVNRFMREVEVPWAGQGVRMARRMKAADLVATLAEETDAAIGKLHAH